MIRREICPVCKEKDKRLFARSQDVELYTSDVSFDYYQCLNCEMIYIDPVPTDKIDVIYPPTYYSYNNEGGSFLDRAKRILDNRQFKAILDKIPGDNLSVLDIGGGTGWTINTIKGLDKRVKSTAVVDLNERARGRVEGFGHRFYCQNIEEFSTDQKFDFIIMLNLIEHIYNPRAVLLKLSRMLTPEGRILIKTPNTDTLDRVIFQNHYWGGLHCPRHWVLFNKNNFQYLVDNSELKIDWLRYTQGAPQWTASLLGTLAKSKIINLSKDRPMDKHPWTNPFLAVFAAFDFLRMPFFPTAQMMVLLKK